MLVTAFREKASENIKSGKTSENSGNDMNKNKDKNLGTNFAQVSFI